MELSVIIPAFNEAQSIKRCIESVLSSAKAYTREVEVIVVDNGSTDSTAAIASEAGAIVISVPDATIGGLRNAGAHVARAPILGFVDADCAVAPDYVDVVLTSQQGNLSISGSKCLCPPTAGWIERIWVGHLLPKTDTIRPVRMVNTGNMVVPRDIFLALGGFNPSLVSGEDSEFCERARTNINIVSNPAIRVFHYGSPKTCVEFFNREYWHGLGALGSFNHNYLDKPLLATLCFALLLITTIILTLSCIIFAAPIVVAFAAAFLLVAFLFVVSFIRSHDRSPKQLFALAILYGIYFAARGLSLVSVIKRSTPLAERAKASGRRNNSCK